MFFSTSSRLNRVERLQLSECVGQPIHLLGSARNEDGILVLTSSHLATYVHDRWEIVEWIHIRGGGWDNESCVLYWELNDGSRHDFHLDKPEQIPAIFAERVRASFLVQRHITLDDGNSIVIAGRRQPGDDAISWHVYPLNHIDVTSPEYQPEIMALIDHMRDEYLDPAAD